MRVARKRAKARLIVLRRDHDQRVPGAVDTEFAVRATVRRTAGDGRVLPGIGLRPRADDQQGGNASDTARVRLPGLAPDELGCEVLAEIHAASGKPCGFEPYCPESCIDHPAVELHGPGKRLYR